MGVTRNLVSSAMNRMFCEKHEMSDSRKSEEGVELTHF